MTDSTMALLIVALQFVTILALVILVRRFGHYADALDRTHQSNRDLIAHLQDTRQAVARDAANRDDSEVDCA